MFVFFVKNHNKTKTSVWKPISLFNETEVLKAYVKSKNKTSDINPWFSKIESMDKRVDLNSQSLKN